MSDYRPHRASPPLVVRVVHLAISVQGSAKWTTLPSGPLPDSLCEDYRGTLRIRNLLGPYSRTMPLLYVAASSDERCGRAWRGPYRFGLARFIQVWPGAVHTGLARRGSYSSGLARFIQPAREAPFLK
jgi:hypothetical protein